MKVYKETKEIWKLCFTVITVCLFTLTLVQLGEVEQLIYKPNNLSMLDKLTEIKETKVQQKFCQVVFTIGLEGVGHHGFVFRHNSFLQRLLQLHMRSRNARSGSNDRMYVKTRSNFNKKLSLNDYSGLFSYFQEKCYEGLGLTECYSTPSLSFPDDRGPFLGTKENIKSAKRWNPEDIRHKNYLFKHGHPINIEKFYFEGSKFCEVKFILLHRNFAEAVLSHHEWDTGWKAHREVLLMFSQYINSSLKSIPQEAWMRINYEDFWRPKEERDLILDKLSSFLKWKASCEEALNISNFRLKLSPKNYDESKCRMIQSLEESQKSRLDHLETYANTSKHPLMLELSHFHSDSPSARWFVESCTQ